MFEFDRRVFSARASAFLLLLSGCGSARATEPASASATTTGDEVAEVEASAPCTLWDPAADPTLAPLDVSAPPEGARRGLNGLRFCILREGTGAVRPDHDDRVRVHYTGWTTDGEMFDSSHTRGEPLALPVSGVIPGWIDALTHMTVGQVRRVWIPEPLAYGGRPGSPAGMLVFDIELISIE